MNFPFVTRRRYDLLMQCAKSTCEEFVKLEMAHNELQKDYQTLLGNAVTEKHKFDDWRDVERSGFQTIYNNLRAMVEGGKR